jgi:hypothetical protein
MLPKRFPSQPKRRRHGTNWGIVNAAGEWAVTGGGDGSPAAFTTRTSAAAWIADQTGTGKDELRFRAFPEGTVF